MSLTHKALHAFKWSVLGEIASQAIGPLVFLVIARLLVPEDFGVIAAAMVIISFSQVFSDAGLAKALIQRQDRTEESANVVFWINLGAGLIIVATLLIAAPLIAIFFHDGRIVAVVRLLSLQILLTAFSSVPTALLQKEMNFKQLFWVRLVATGAPGLASIPLAMYGMGYWALVAGTLFGQVVQSIVLWNRSHWRPYWGLDRALAKELVAFGKWAMLSGLLGWFYVWMDAIVVGHYLGPNEMGLYRTGNTFVTMVFGIILSPMLPVLYSAFSKVQLDQNKVRSTLIHVVKGIALLVFPVAALLVGLREQIEGYVFGGGWSGVGTLIAILAISHAFAWLVGANGEAYRAVGKPQMESLAMIISVAVYFIGYIVSVQFSLVVFALTRVGLVFFGLLSQIVISKYLFSIQFMQWVKVAYKPLLFSVALLAGQVISQPYLSDGLLSAVGQVVCCLILYFALVAIFDREYYLLCKSKVKIN